MTETHETGRFHSWHRDGARACARRLLLGTVIGLAASLSCGSPALCAPSDPGGEWPVPPSRMELETPYGRLHVETSEYIYEARLLIDDKPTEPRIEGLLNITYAFSTTTSHAALVSISQGNEACPVSYRWIVLDKSGYKLSPAFGSCSNEIRVDAKRGKFIVTTPNQKKPDKIDTYVYDGKQIRRRGTP